MEITIREALAFDDVQLEPTYSETLPDAVNTAGRFSRRIELSVPLPTAVCVAVATWSRPWQPGPIAPCRAACWQALMKRPVRSSFTKAVATRATLVPRILPSYSAKPPFAG